MLVVTVLVKGRSELSEEVDPAFAERLCAVAINTKCNNSTAETNAAHKGCFFPRKHVTTGIAAQSDGRNSHSPESHLQTNRLVCVFARGSAKATFPVHAASQDKLCT